MVETDVKFPVGLLIGSENTNEQYVVDAYIECLSSQSLVRELTFPVSKKLGDYEAGGLDGTSRPQYQRVLENDSLDGALRKLSYHKNVDGIHDVAVLNAQALQVLRDKFPFHQTYELSEFVAPTPVPVYSGCVGTPPNLVKDFSEE